MKTDKQFYKLFSELPGYFFDLTEVHYPAQYKFRSETIKEFSRSMDGLSGTRQSKCASYSCGISNAEG